MIMKKTKTYQIRNWREYNTSLKKKGAITVWASEDALTRWNAPKDPGHMGRPFIYSDEAIKLLLMLQAVYKLPLRALEGFAQSIFNLMQLSLAIPSYTQISRRARSLGQDVQVFTNHRVTDIVIDSSGLKVYGDGEWKVRTHGASKRRTWRKFHLIVDPHSHEIVMSALTKNDVGDSQVYDQLADQLPRTVKTSRGDGAYDNLRSYEASHRNNIQLVTPPQKNAVIHENPPECLNPRNDACIKIASYGGDEDARKKWKREVNYHRRSLAETAMFRFKKTFGDKLSYRRMDAQKAELWAKSMVLNVMARLGMPKGQWVETCNTG